MGLTVKTGRKEKRSWEEKGEGRPWEEEAGIVSREGQGFLECEVREANNLGLWAWPLICLYLWPFLQRSSCLSDGPAHFLAKTGAPSVCLCSASCSATCIYSILSDSLKEREARFQWFLKVYTYPEIYSGKCSVLIDQTKISLSTQRRLLNLDFLNNLLKALPWEGSRDTLLVKFPSGPFLQTSFLNLAKRRKGQYH